MNNKQPIPQRNYRDTIFRMIFSNKKELLALYNAVNDTNYDNEDELEITTLENAIYMSIKNDISCVIDMRINLYEHQSTVNPKYRLGIWTMLQECMSVYTMTGIYILPK